MWSKVILCFLFKLNILFALNVGDSCVPNRNLAEGFCSLVTDCESALRQIQIKRTHDFERCGFEGRIEVVCCPRATDTRIGTSSTKRPSGNSQRIADRECQRILDSAIKALNLHIIDGEEATIGEFPHMVALGHNPGDGFGYTFKCGGSLISKDFVLTAAHCVDNKEQFVPTLVRTGVVELENNEWDDATDVGISEIIKHPEHRPSKKYHDLALLRLNKSLSFTSELNAACLDTGNAEPSLPLTITGWGQTSNTKDAKSTLLLKADIRSVPIAKCRESYNNWLALPQGLIENQLCAGDPNGIKDACQGDSGGPLQSSISSENVYKVVGITSFGRGCGSPVPGVYTRVAKYVDWIESIVWPR